MGGGIIPESPPHSRTKSAMVGVPMRPRIKAALLDPNAFFHNGSTSIEFLLDYVAFVVQTSFKAIGKGKEVQRLEEDGGKGPRIPITYKTMAKILNAIARHFKFSSLVNMANSDLKVLDVGTDLGLPFSVLYTLTTVYGAEMDEAAAAVVGQLCRNRDRVFVGDSMCRPRTEAKLYDTPYSLPWRMSQPSITKVDVTEKTFAGTTKPRTINIILNLTAARFEVHVCGGLVLLTMKAFPPTGVLMYCELQHGRDLEKFKTAGLVDEDMGNLLHMEGGVLGGIPFHLSVPIGSCSRTIIGFTVREPHRAAFAQYCSDNRSELSPDFDVDLLPPPTPKPQPEPKEVGQGIDWTILVL